MKRIYFLLVKSRTFPASIKFPFLAVAFVLISLSSFSSGVLPDTKAEQADILSAGAKFFPFELIAFQAKQKGNEKVILNWTTGTEINTSHFVMQRSIDGNVFDDAALLFTAEGDRNEKTEYNYADDLNRVKTGVVYYRLKMVDMNGAYQFSDAVKVNIQKAKDLVARN